MIPENNEDVDNLFDKEKTDDPIETDEVIGNNEETKVDLPSGDQGSNSNNDESGNLTEDNEMLENPETDPIEEPAVQDG